MTDAKVLPFPRDNPPRSPEEVIEEEVSRRTRPMEGHLRAAVEDLEKAIEEGERQMADPQQGTGLPAADSRGEMAERSSEPTTPIPRAQGNLQRTISALEEELRKVKIKEQAARQRKEWREAQACKSSQAILLNRLEVARRFLKQIAKANTWAEQVEKDLGGATA